MPIAGRKVRAGGAIVVVGALDCLNHDSQLYASLRSCKVTLDTHQQLLLY